jgi:multiple sugar transport system permease protein
MPQDPIEAAVIDGANTFQKYTKVIFPMLDNIFKLVMIFSIMGSFKIFDKIWVLTKGDPYRSSETLALTMYVESFVKNHLGQGAAIAVLLSTIVIILSYIQLKHSFYQDQN